MKKQDGKVIQAQAKFALNDSPDAYVIGLHMRNMMSVYGEERVLSIIKELFLAEQPKNRTRKTAVGE